MILDTSRLGYQETNNFCMFSWTLILAFRRTQAVKRRFKSRLFYSIEVSVITYPLHNKIPQVSLHSHTCPATAYFVFSFYLK